MCNPMLAIGALTSIISYQQQVESAKQQQAYQNAVAQARNEEINANNIAANAAAIASYSQLNQRQAEEDASMAEKNLDLNVEKNNAIGELTASNLNTGLSFDMLKLDYERQANRYEGIQQANLKAIGLQTEADKRQAEAQAQNQMNSVQGYIQQPVSTPSPLSLAVGLGSAYVNSLNTDMPTFGKKTATTTTSDWRDGGSYRKMNYNY